MTALNKQVMRNTADRDWFESWFKSDFHPDKTGPYIKDQLFFAIQAARKPLLDELEAAEKRIAELSASHSKLRDTIATIHNTIRMDGGYTPLAAILNAAKRAHEESATAAGIGVKGE